MTPLMHRVALATLIACGTAAPAWADPASSASSASSTASQSVGSISGSIQKSSNSSSGNTVAEGDYRIIEVAEVADQPGTMRMKLQAVHDIGADGEFYLYLPHQVVEQGRLAAGGVVTARNKAYGVEFAHAKTLKGFFMALKDEWTASCRRAPSRFELAAPRGARAGVAPRRPLPAQAGALRYCDSPGDLSHEQRDRLFRFASIVRGELEASGQRLALVSRSGLDLARFGMRYSHTGAEPRRPTRSRPGRYASSTTPATSASRACSTRASPPSCSG